MLPRMRGSEAGLLAMASRRRRSPTTEPSTRPASRAGATTSFFWRIPSQASRYSPATLAELGTVLDAFRAEYNEERPHRAIGRATPGEAYRASAKARPSNSHGLGHFRLRYDVTDGKGVITLRRAGRLHHLNAGVAHARRRVLAIVDETDVTLVALDTGQVLSSHRIEPTKGYWRNQRRNPGRWPRSLVSS